MNIDSKIQLIKKYYPQLQNAYFEPDEKGWANLVIIADNKYIFRFPRNVVSERDLQIESEILPKLIQVSNLLVPEFMYISPDNCSQVFVGYEMIAGVSLLGQHLEALGEQDQERIAFDLAIFLKTLHTLNDKHTFEKLRQKPLQKDRWIELRDEILESCTSHLSNKESSWIYKLLTDHSHSYNKASKAGNFKQALVHGDFSSDHILYNEDNKQLAGIIDFGDLELGDPAIDFTGLYICYGEAFTKQVLNHYDRGQTDRILNRVETFYLKQVPLHGLLHGVKTNSKKNIEQSLKFIRAFIESE